MHYITKFQIDEARKVAELKASELLRAMGIPENFPGYRLFHIRIVSIAMDHFFAGALAQINTEAVTK